MPTMEELQQQVLDLQEENAQLRTSNETLSQERENLQHEIDDVRTLNQKMFLKLTAEQSKADDDDGKNDPPAKSCADVAKELASKF
jgi:regulator of replication initiation timing